MSRFRVCFFGLFSTIALFAVVILFATHCAVTCAEDRDPNPTPKPKDAGPLDVVTYSDGRVVKGKLFIRGETNIKAFDLERKTYVTFPFSDVVGITVRIEAESMEKVWYFKEEGNPEKTYTGEEYPLRSYITRFKLRNGAEFETHFTGVISIKIEDQEDRVFFFIKQKGDTTQSLKDLVYVTSVEFFDRRLIDKGANIVLQTDLKDEKIARAIALSWSANQCFEAKPAKASIEWKRLPPDKYDLFVITDKNLYYCLSAITKLPKGGGDDSDLLDLDEKPLDGETNKPIAGLNDEEKSSLTKYIEGAEEFFDIKQAVAFGGNVKQARVLVLQAKVEETSYGTKAKNLVLWRYDLWYLHKIQLEWKTDSRAFVWRSYLPAGDKSGIIALKSVDKLGGVDLTKGGSTQNLTLSSAEQR